MAKYKDFDDEIIFDSGSSNPVKSVRNKKKKKIKEEDILLYILNK